MKYLKVIVANLKKQRDKLHMDETFLYQKPFGQKNMEFYKNIKKGRA
jgi:hypothetical protein